MEQGMKRKQFNLAAIDDVTYEARSLAIHYQDAHGYCSSVAQRRAIDNITEEYGPEVAEYARKSLRE